MPEWLTVPEAADYLKCSVPTIYRRIKAGELPAYKSGKMIRVKREDLDQMFEEK